MNKPAIHTTTSLAMDEAESRLREALRDEGFGVLTEVDVQAVMRDKLGEEVAPYRILGVCNPQLAYQALSAWKGFGLIAPCHVALYDEGDHRVVIAFDPAGVDEVREHPELAALAGRASEAIDRAVRSLQET